MSSQTTTFDLAANHIAPYVQNLVEGDFALPFESRDQDSHLLNFDDDYFSGHHTLLVFLNELKFDSFTDLLTGLADKQEEYEENNIQIIIITANSDAGVNRKIKRQFQLHCPILNDSTGAIFASYGLLKTHGTPCRLVQITPLRQIRKWYNAPSNIKGTLEEIMTTAVESSITQTTPWSQPHAPILLIPNVLSQDECKLLISTFTPNVPFSVRQPRQGEFPGDYQIPVYEHNRQDRVDQIIKDQNTLGWLEQKIWTRVTPMIKKAFAFEVTRREDLHIARYTGERSGNHIGHRDNTSAATAYRRFAFSMNLNDDYEGGELRFNEYTKQGYRAAPGTAMVFSSSLLHEVMETTKGTRYNLITHFFNEASLAEFQKK